MYLDADNLPVQENGDANDQLQRCAMVVQGVVLCEQEKRADTLTCFDASLNALCTTHQPKWGIYVRHKGADPRNCSGDQLISALAAWVTTGRWWQAMKLTLRILMRGGFAQNTLDGLDGGENTKKKLPDFILLRALPLMWRCHPFISVAGIATSWYVILGYVKQDHSAWTLLALLLTTDLPLLLAALVSSAPVWKDNKGFARRTPDDVDDNVPTMTYLACNEMLPGLFSTLAWWWHRKFRAWNYGCTNAETLKQAVEGQYTEKNKYKPAYGALRWYHRAETGGNPEIAKLFKPMADT